MFTGGYGFEGGAEARAAAHLDFDEDDCGTVAQDQVQFPVTGPVVALDEDVAAPGQVAQREFFAPRARAPVVQLATPL